MWHEARKQEKKIRGMMVDYKRRAERRRDYYEKIKQDPAQFLQVHGRPAKIHLDPAVAMAADSPATMMPWQGHADNLIDRFDVRAHLDIIPEYKPSKNDDEPGEDRQACYERYRTLVQNDFLGVGEDKFLHQIFLEERFGIFKPGPEEEKKKLLDKKVAIGYVYEDSTGSPTRSSMAKDMDDEDEENEEEKEDDLSDLDLDVTIDVSVLTPSQSAEMNEHSTKYGMVDDDFITYLLQDKDEADQLRLAREIEEEKAMYSGRKSRRERRALREKKLAGRKITSPPSYAARDSPTYTPMRNSTSKSRSRSPPEAGKIMFITSFGGEVSDGEKSGNKNNASNSKTAKTKSKDSGVSVIGPQLPSKDNDKSDKKSKTSKGSPCSDSSRSSSHSKRKDTKSKRSHGRSRRRSRSSSSRSRSRSRSPKKSSSRDKRKRPRRHSSSSRSRSRTRSPRSRSRSRLHSRHARTRSRSVSRSKTDDKSHSPLLPPPPIKSYYRHSLSRSNSEVSDDSEGDRSPIRTNQLSNITSSSKLQPLLGKAGLHTKETTKLTPQERLKRKMQIALKKQYKADKKAQMEKTEKQLQEQQDRAEELREMAIKLRQRERERRHKMRGYGYDSDSDSTWTKNPDYDSRNSDHYSKKSGSGSSRSSSYSSDETSPAQSFSSSSRRRSRSKSPPPRVSRRSPVDDRRRSSPPPTSYRKRSPLRKSPTRKSSPIRSPVRNSVKSPRRSPQYSRRSPDRSYRDSRSRQSPARKYSPPRNSRRRSPSVSPPRQHSSSRQYRQRNYSPRRSKSPPRSYGSRPLVDY